MIKIKEFFKLIVLGSVVTFVLGLMHILHAANTKDVNIAIILCCGVESPWDATMVESMERVKQAKPHGLNITYEYTEPIYGDAVMDAMTLFAESGDYDIIICHMTCSDMVQRINKDYPDVAFVSVGSGNSSKGGNEYWIYKRVHEAAYALGVLAGHMTESGVLGVVGTFPADDVNDEINAYFAGARTVKPDLIQKVSFIESWYDPGKAAEMTSAQISMGADMIFTLASNFAACEENNLLCFGNFADESHYSPSTHLSAPIAIWDRDITRIIDGWFDYKENGVPQNGNTEMMWTSMKDGGAVVAPFHGLADRIPANIRKIFDNTVNDIMSGDLVVELDVSEPKSD